MIRYFSALYAGHVLAGEGIGFSGTPAKTVAYLQEIEARYPGLEHILLGFPMGTSLSQFKE